MNYKERRQRIAKLLSGASRPYTGTELGERFGVSRQIIVGDVSYLKSEGFEILSTHNGYVMQKSAFVERVFKVKHTGNETEDELTGIVDLGGMVADVFVLHQTYGKMQVQLNLYSREQIQKFVDTMGKGESKELMSITGGYHYHTVRADAIDTLNRIEKFLTERNYLISVIK